MKKTILTLIHLTISIFVFGQSKIDKQTSKIIEEGRNLYKSEMASWYGTDIFFEKFADKKQISGGYLSYTENSITKCIFFSKSESPKVISTISFDSTFNIQTAIADGSEREFTEVELQLYEIRKLALVEARTDTLFKFYKNTNLNFIPIIHKSEKKVYVLTGPQNNGVVIIGNDYLLTFDKKNKLIEKKRLHKNIIPIDYAKAKEEEVVTMHSHLPETGDFITATDVCTLMLYEKFANWKQHLVISNDYVNIWDCKNNSLAILTKLAWENIYKNQKEEKKE